MGEEKIRKLLDLYFEGESSIQEEQELRTYFSAQDVSEEFASFAPLFSFFERENQAKMEGDIDVTAVTKPVARTIGMRWYLRVAASIAIFISVFYLNRSLPKVDANQYAYEDTYDDPEEAYAEVKRALLYVSQKMNKGVDAASFSLEKMAPLDDILH